MTTDQLISTVLIVVLAAAGIALLALMERTHRRARHLGRPWSGDDDPRDADGRRLAEDLRTLAGSDGQPPRMPHPVRNTTPAGVTSLSRHIRPTEPQHCSDVA